MSGELDEARRPRRAPERRTQLLEAAAELVADRGVVGFTMEGLAAHAGVSKALPYRHFDNADHVLVELYQLEVNALAGRILAAIRGHHGDDLVAVAVHAYFDAIAERGVVLGRLSGTGSHVPERAAAAVGGQEAAWLERLVRTAYPQLDAAAALGLGRIVAGTLQAAGWAVARREIRRGDAEAASVAATVAAAHALLGA
ncbi:MAG TPA: helix-turn-helix domain-containing protein [Acidimicrobiales bacterium]|nr:helix-turn-helix domain-containing protein [Acidimicrobiales bacterium]